MSGLTEPVRGLASGLVSGLVSTTAAVLDATAAQVIPVPRCLAPCIATMWLVDLRAGQRVHALPDGTVDIVGVIKPGQPPRWVVSGPLHRFASYSHACAVRLVGASLQPGAACLLGVGARDLSSKWQPIEDLGLPEGRGLTLASGVDMVTALTEFVEARARRAHFDAKVAQAVAALRVRAGSGRVRDLARDLRVSERTLVRLFDRHVGLSPKGFARIVRFQHALMHCRRIHAHGLADLAAKCGYADQAHLTREFSALAGIAPAALQRLLL